MSARPTPPDGVPALEVDPHLTLATDGTFAGLLSAYGAAYRRRALPSQIVQAGAAVSGALFADVLEVGTDDEVAGRLERGLERAVPGIVARMRRAFLSERPGIEVAVIRLAEAVRLDPAVVEDWTFEPSRTVSQWSGRVGREAHRMEAFVRFETRSPSADSGQALEGGSEQFVAEIRPEYNVLPILHHHFETRYPTLAWRIVDVRRGIALVHTPEPDRAPGQPATALVPTSDLEVGEHTSEESAYQSMWRAYFRAVDIPERKNLKLHLRHVPKRYWPYLVEKQPVIETPASRSEPDAPSRPRRAVPARGPA